MAWRDREWFLAAIRAAQMKVAAAQAQIARCIEAGEFDAAASHCDVLKACLGDLNRITNQFADKFGG